MQFVVMGIALRSRLKPDPTGIYDSVDG